MIKPIKFKVGRGKQEDLPTKYIDGFIWFAVDTGKLYIDAPINGTLERTLINPDVDWSQLPNHPEDLAQIYYNTKEGWNNQANLIGQKNALYVYTNAREEDGKNIPDFKIGDGSSYLIDSPFITTTLFRAYHSTVDEENLIFTTD